ncbi:hypothetical protein LC55x_5600 [Lysobacter capsici]|nr:hypothetical protein LC55x_5600 [Lysobacter capsici]
MLPGLSKIDVRIEQLWATGTIGVYQAAGVSQEVVRHDEIFLDQLNCDLA